MLAAFRRAALISKDNKTYDKKSDKEDDTLDDKVLKPKKKHPGFVLNLCDYFSEYSSSSSIHGIKYMGEQKRTIIEKLWWLVVFGASLYICIYMIIKTYEKWESSPVIVSFARSSTPVWQVPFPAVTICSETKTRQTVYNFTDAYQRNLINNLTLEEEGKIEKISLVCDSHLHAKGNETINYDTLDFLTEVSPPFDEVFYECKWMNKKENCSNLFTPMLSEEGICFTFNMLDREELFKDIVFQNRNYLSHGVKATNWTLEGGYPKDLGRDAFPRRAISAGQGAGLTVLLRAYEKDLDYVCRGPVQGFKALHIERPKSNPIPGDCVEKIVCARMSHTSLLLHHPAEIPRVSQQYFRAPLNQEVVVSIKPDMMTTSDGLKSYHPHRRQCYFPSERQLSFYQVYTQQNCEVECLTNFTLKYCGCVSYHMPHDKSTKLCGSGKTICVHEAQVKLLSQEVEKSLDLFDDEQLDKDKIGHQECDCLPACTSLTYNSENSQADFNWPKVFEAQKNDAKDLKGAKMTGLTLFFKEMQFITSERSELYGPTDFLASCGGLLGLFMGFSFLSIIEILYFLSLRLMCNVKNFGRPFWSGSADLLENDAYEHQH